MSTEVEKANVTIRATERALIRKYGARQRRDIERGVRACAVVWGNETGRGRSNGKMASLDGGFQGFCLEQYTPPGKKRHELLRRLDEFHLAVAGGMGVALKVARAGLDIADRPLLAAEKVLGAFSPFSHLSEDYRDARIAAIVQLNFGTDDRTAPRSRAGWAARRLGEVGREVVPANLLTAYSRAESEASLFVSSYNLHLDRFDFGNREVSFPPNTVLVSHWGLRDHMTSLTGESGALPKQRAILDLMRRVVDGEIPAAVLDNPSPRWNIANGTLREGGRTRRAEGHGPLRWEHFRKVWQAHRRIDPYRRYGSVIDNKFLAVREIPEEKVVGILTEILASPLAERAARFLRDKLKRPLEPFDVYYRDFSPRRLRPVRSRINCRKKYPSAEALQAAIPDVLARFGWGRQRARWIGERIRVDNGRSAGHAWPPYSPSDQQLLRVRVDRGGCDELNFETFMHELGHCVEGVLSSFEMDYNVLWGVPNTAVTEGFAFTFQDRTDEILGRKQALSPEARTLQRFWEPYEIAGSALTEVRFFHWLYENPRASAAAMQRAIRSIGDEVWGEFFARIFGDEGHGLMSIYSHILTGDFYLADYPMGFVMAYQIRKYLEGRPLHSEMERMCGVGRVYPDSWMRAAVGQGISVAPLLQDTERALRKLGY